MCPWKGGLKTLRSSVIVVRIGVIATWQSDPANFDELFFSAFGSDVGKCDAEVISFDMAFEFRYNVLLCAETSAVDNCGVLNLTTPQISLDDSRE